MADVDNQGTSFPAGLLMTGFDSLTNVIECTESTVNVTSWSMEKKIIFGVGMFAFVGVTFFANLFVLVSFVVEKRLRTTFSALIANLAFADMLVACTAMDFYTINIILGYWPFGKVLCGVWVVCDYTLVFASCYTLAAIAVDRAWSIKFSINYRKHNSMRKAVAFIATIWGLVFAIVLYPIITDRVLRTEPCLCKFVPSENLIFVVVLAALGHHTPCIIIVTCSVLVIFEMNRLSRTRPCARGILPSWPRGLRATLPVGGLATGGDNGGGKEFAVRSASLGCLKLEGSTVVSVGYRNGCINGGGVNGGVSLRELLKMSVSEANMGEAQQKEWTARYASHQPQHEQELEQEMQQIHLQQKQLKNQSLQLPLLNIPQNGLHQQQNQQQQQREEEQPQQQRPQRQSGPMQPLQRHEQSGQHPPEQEQQNSFNLLRFYDKKRQQQYHQQQQQQQQHHHQQQHETKQKLHKQLQPNRPCTLQELARTERERRTFVTLSYIVLFYVICWVPFHIVYDISITDLDLSLSHFFSITFWMTYLNSTVNPFLYAFTSSDVRKTIRRIVTCRVWKMRSSY